VENMVLTSNLQHTLDDDIPDTNGMEELRGFTDRHVFGD
jgi:hypothetical protein